MEHPGKVLRTTQAVYSDSVETGISDGMHTDAQGRTRVYKGGRYFRSCMFALNGLKYLADDNGFLRQGWIIDIEGSNINTVQKTSMVFYYFDPATYQALRGYQKIDGLGHYFSEYGVLNWKEEMVTVDGRA